MKLLSVIVKSFKEQMRNFWILILTVSMAPFFIFIYYLMLETSNVQYDILIHNKDEGIEYLSQKINYGKYIEDIIAVAVKDTFDLLNYCFYHTLSHLDTIW